MARAAVIPGVADPNDQPAPRSTRGRGRSAQTQTSSNKTEQPAKRGRKPGKTATTTTSATAQKKKQTGSSNELVEEEDDSTDDEIGFDVVAKSNNKSAAASRVVRRGRQAKSASVQSEQEQQSDQGEDEEEDDDDDDDDELAQLGVMGKKTVRPKSKTTTTTTTNKAKPEPATRPTRGRPKMVKNSEPAATTTTRKTRGRPPTKPEAEKKIYVATNSSLAKSRPVGEPAVRKKVTFADLADSEDEVSEKEEPVKTTAAKKQTKSQPAAGLKAKPVRKTAGTAGRGRPAKSQPAAKPLSPKKATQLTKNSSASSGDEDELASEKNIYSLVVRSPTRNQAPQHTGLSSPVKRINFTGSTPTPSRPSSRMENDENSVPGVQPPSALRDPAFLGSPARRPPPSTSKDTMKDTPRRGPLFASQLAAPNIAHTEASTPTRLSPLKVSPKKGANLGASFLASPEKGLSTPFNAKLSLLKSPAKKIQSPFVFQKVTTTSSNVDEDVDMDGHAATADDKKSSEHVDNPSDDKLRFEIKPAGSTEASDDVFVGQPVRLLEEQQDMHVADDYEHHVEESTDYQVQNDGEDKENAQPEVSKEAADVEEPAEPQLHDNEIDENMQEEYLAMDVGQDADIPDQNMPVENNQVNDNAEYVQDGDHMEEDEDVVPSEPDENTNEQVESDEVKVENAEEVHPETSETHEPSPSELEPAINTLSIQPEEQAKVTSDDNAEDAVMHSEHEHKDGTGSEMVAPVSPAVSLAMSMSTKSIRHVYPDEIDEPQSANKTATTFVPPSAPTPPTNPARMHSLMFSYRDTQDDVSSVYDPSPLKRRSRVSTRESILPQTPSASASADLPFSPLAAQLSKWKASSPEKTQTDRPQRSIFSPVIPSQLKMKPQTQTPTKNRYSQIQTMRHSLAARHSLANSIHMDDNETDTVERPSEQNEEQPDAGPDPQTEPEKSKSPPVPAESRPSMSITPVRVIRDANRTIHTVSKVPLKPEGDISPIKFPRKRARAMSFDMDLPIRASPNRVKLIPKSRMHLSPSPRKQRVPLGEIEPPHHVEDATPDPPAAPASPVKTPRANSKAEEQVLRGAVVFVDVHTTEGEDASGIFVELLTQMGAKCVRSWSWNGRSSQSPVDGAEPAASKVGITHVVYKDGGVRTMEKVRQARNLVKCVGVGWVLDCERENKWLDESRYNVDSTIIPRGGAKRRKSMQPRALANVNGSLLSSSTSSRPSRNSTEWEGTVENFRRMSPSPSTPPPATGESFLSKIPEAPKTPTPGGGESSYTFNFDFSAMSPATPYFLSQPSRLVQQTCPPKQTNQGLFTVNNESHDPRTNRDLRAKLEAARRKSLAFKPRLESPLSQS